MKSKFKQTICFRNVKLPYSPFLLTGTFGAAETTRQTSTFTKRITAAQRQEQTNLILIRDSLLTLLFLNSLSYFQSQPLSNHYSKEVTKKKLTYGMVSWVSNYFEILDFKLVWFDTMYKLPCTGTLIYRVNYFACSARCIWLSQNTLCRIICTKV